MNQTGTKHPLNVKKWHQKGPNGFSKQQRRVVPREFSPPRQAELWSVAICPARGAMNVSFQRGSESRPCSRWLTPLVTVDVVTRGPVVVTMVVSEYINNVLGLKEDGNNHNHHHHHRHCYDFNGVYIYI